MFLVIFSYFEFALFSQNLEVFPGLLWSHDGQKFKTICSYSSNHVHHWVISSVYVVIQVAISELLGLFPANFLSDYFANKTFLTSHSSDYMKSLIKNENWIFQLSWLYCFPISILFPFYLCESWTVRDVFSWRDVFQIELPERSGVIQSLDLLGRIKSFSSQEFADENRWGCFFAKEVCRGDMKLKG